MLIQGKEGDVLVWSSRHLNLHLRAESHLPSVSMSANIGYLCAWLKGDSCSVEICPVLRKLNVLWMFQNSRGNFFCDKFLPDTSLVITISFTYSNPPQILKVKG